MNSSDEAQQPQVWFTSNGDLVHVRSSFVMETPLVDEQKSDPNTSPTQIVLDEHEKYKSLTERKVKTQNQVE